MDLNTGSSVTHVLPGRGHAAGWPGPGSETPARERGLKHPLNVPWAPQDTEVLRREWALLVPLGSPWWVALEELIFVCCQGVSNSY